MGALSCRFNLASISPEVGRGPSNPHARKRKLTRKQRKLSEQFLPNFQFREASSATDASTAGGHWNIVFHDGASSKSAKSNNSQARNDRANQEIARVKQLFDIFYEYLETHAPEVKHVFRASMHVQSKVLMHISTGMRALLMSEDFAERVLQLTKTHISFGVQPEYFNSVGQALIHAMKESSSHCWSDDIEVAWQRLYGHCSVLLIEQQMSMTEQDGDEKNGTANSKVKRLPRGCAQLVDKYLPSFNYKYTSSEEHRTIAAKHWNEVFRESNGSSRMSRGENSRSQSCGPSRLSFMYDTFFDFLEKNSPQLKNVFRSSMHIRSRVLIHISAGLRTLLQSGNLNEKIKQLTRTHLRFGVKLEHYDALGLALIHSMKESSDGEWSAAVENAWCRLFGHCGALLIYQQKKEMERKSAAPKQDADLTNILNSSASTVTSYATSSRQSIAP